MTNPLNEEKKKKKKKRVNANVEYFFLKKMKDIRYKIYFTESLNLSNIQIQLGLFLVIERMREIYWEENQRIRERKKESFFFFKKKRNSFVTLRGFESSQTTPDFPHTSSLISQFKFPFEIKEV